MLIFLASPWLEVVWVAVGLVIGIIAGFFIGRSFFQKQLKKNPPINEKMIRAMFMSMGRKPSEAQVRQVMKSMEQNR